MAGAFHATYKQFPHGTEDVWIETGTYRGNSMKIALEFGFAEIHTIEVSKASYDALPELQPALCRDPRVHRYLGSSRDLLGLIIERVLDRDVIFWLDGHYQGESLDERDAISECPLLDELGIIARAPFKRSVLIAIDDAYLFHESFFERHPLRGKFTQVDWPTNDQIQAAMRGWGHGVTEDILYFYRNFSS